MARHRKLRGRKLKKQRRIIIVSVIALTLLLSTGYAAFSTNISLSAKGNIKEKPAAEVLKEDVLDSSATIDGLYQDVAETDRYIYRGADPDNYICLGDLSNGTCPSDSMYRIISIESDGSLKVIKNTSIGTQVWDPGYERLIVYNNSVTITAQNKVIGTRYSSTSANYCYVSSISSYYGCKSWGSATSTLDSSGSTTSTMIWEVGGATYTLPTYNSWLNVYLNGGTYHAEASTASVTGWIDGGSTGLNGISKSKVLSTKAFNIGPVAIGDASTTLSTSRTQEAAYKWKGKVGLMNITDYVAAGTNSSCSNLYNYNASSTCSNNSNTHNWLFSGSYEWTISPTSVNRTANVFSIFSGGAIGGDYASSSNPPAVRPALYLKSDITLKGSGTSGSPYYIDES